MRRIRGTQGIQNVECINPYIQKYRVRWNIQNESNERGIEGVSFVEAEFLHKPTPEEIEKTISSSGIDASDTELTSIAEQLGYAKEVFDKLWDKGRDERIASDPYAQMFEVIKMSNSLRTNVTNEEALKVPNTFRGFHELCKEGKQLEKGVVLRYDNKVWRVIQPHTPQSIYPPSLSTAALYEHIEPGHTGTQSDPIPYAPPMQIYNGKYYTQNGAKYKCNRDSGQPLTHDLSALVGLYVEKVAN